jgi:hypothetical protein
MREKYLALLHAMQTGVAYVLEWEPNGECSPKHLRTGVNNALISNGALAALCIEKGLFTEEEYLAKLVEYAQRDVDSYTARIQKKLGRKVTLG